MAEILSDSYIFIISDCIVIIDIIISSFAHISYKHLPL